MSAYNSIHPSRRCQCGSADTVASVLLTGDTVCGSCLVDVISDQRGIPLEDHHYMMPPHLLLMALQACPEVLPKDGMFARWRRVQRILNDVEGRR